MARQPQSYMSPRGSKDYQACANFFNNYAPTPDNGRGYRSMDYGVQSRSRLRYLPFRLESNGSISAFSDTRTACDQISRTCTYTYESPQMSDLEKIDRKRLVNDIVTLGGTTLHSVDVVVTRDNNGDITEILEGLPPNHNQQTRDMRYSSIVGVRSILEVQNGMCVPMRSSEVFTREEEEDGETITKRTELPVFITPLCRDIHDAFEASGILLSVFDEDLNAKVFRSVLGKHQINLIAADGEEVSEELRKFQLDLLDANDGDTVPFLDERSATGEELDQLHIKEAIQGTLPVQILLGIHARVLTDREMQRLGSSTILYLSKILALCNYRNLSYFITNDSMWQ